MQTTNSQVDPGLDPALGSASAGATFSPDRDPEYKMDGEVAKSADPVEKLILGAQLAPQEKLRLIVSYLQNPQAFSNPATMKIMLQYIMDTLMLVSYLSENHRIKNDSTRELTSLSYLCLAHVPSLRHVLLNEIIKRIRYLVNAGQIAYQPDEVGEILQIALLINPRCTPEESLNLFRACRTLFFPHLNLRFPNLSVLPPALKADFQRLIAQTQKHLEPTSQRLATDYVLGEKSEAMLQVPPEEIEPLSDLLQKYGVTSCRQGNLFVSDKLEKFLKEDPEATCAFVQAQLSSCAAEEQFPLFNTLFSALTNLNPMPKLPGDFCFALLAIVQAKSGDLNVPTKINWVTALARVCETQTDHSEIIERCRELLSSLKQVEPIRPEIDECLSIGLARLLPLDEATVSWVHHQDYLESDLDLYDPQTWTNIATSLKMISAIAMNKIDFGDKWQFYEALMGRTISHCEQMIEQDGCRTEALNTIVAMWFPEDRQEDILTLVLKESLQDPGNENKVQCVLSAIKNCYVLNIALPVLENICSKYPNGWSTTVYFRALDSLRAHAALSAHFYAWLDTGIEKLLPEQERNSQYSYQYAATIDILQRVNNQLTSIERSHLPTTKFHHSALGKPLQALLDDFDLSKLQAAADVESEVHCYRHPEMARLEPRKFFHLTRKIWQYIPKYFESRFKSGEFNRFIFGLLCLGFVSSFVLPYLITAEALFTTLQFSAQIGLGAWAAGFVLVKFVGLFSKTAAKMLSTLPLALTEFAAVSLFFLSKLFSTLLTIPLDCYIMLIQKLNISSFIQFFWEMPFVDKVILAGKEKRYLSLVNKHKVQEADIEAWTLLEYEKTLFEKASSQNAILDPAPDFGFSILGLLTIGLLEFCVGSIFAGAFLISLEVGLVYFPTAYLLGALLGWNSPKWKISSFQLLLFPDRVFEVVFNQVLPFAWKICLTPIAIAGDVAATIILGGMRLISSALSFCCGAEQDAPSAEQSDEELSPSYSRLYHRVTADLAHSASSPASDSTPPKSDGYGYAAGLIAPGSRFNFGSPRAEDAGMASSAGPLKPGQPGAWISDETSQEEVLGEEAFRVA